MQGRGLGEAPCGGHEHGASRFGMILRSTLILLCTQVHASTDTMLWGAAVIATNWSGPTAFLDSSVGFPLRIDGLTEVSEDGAFEGHNWAAPSISHLQQLMKHAVAHPEEGRLLGRWDLSPGPSACL